MTSLLAIIGLVWVLSIAALLVLVGAVATVRFVQGWRSDARYRRVMRRAAMMPAARVVRR